MELPNQQKKLIHQRITDNLRECCRAAAMTQRELAAASNITEPSISLYLNGKKLPSIPVLFRLAEALGVTPADLLDLGTGTATTANPQRAQQLVRKLGAQLSELRQSLGSAS